MDPDVYVHVSRYRILPYIFRSRLDKFSRDSPDAELPSNQAVVLTHASTARVHNPRSDWTDITVVY